MSSLLEAGDSVTRSDVQEALLHLYLRLNGYFTTGFIVHAPLRGMNRTQVDALAVRHPFSEEPERVLGPSPFLDLTQGVTDVLLCEVKSKGSQLQFNQSLRKAPDVALTVLRWAGLFSRNELAAIVQSLHPCLQPGYPRSKGAAGVLVHETIRVRALLCSLETTSPRPNQPWSLHGAELFRYIGECLTPYMERATCATRYDFSAWGSWLQPVVRLQFYGHSLDFGVVAKSVFA